jgi:SAM-dependent methyltransferase
MPYKKQGYQRMSPLLRSLIPAWIRNRIVPRGLAGLRCSPPVGWVRFGGLRRLRPVSRNWGEERGRPLDRHYIERFIASHAADIRGRVLEVGDNVYTVRFGGNIVAVSDILHVNEGDPSGTVFGDLANAPHIPDASFDCIVLTQTLQLIYDLEAAVATIHRLLKPGGVVLATVPGITHICHDDSDTWAQSWFWSFTKLSARRVFETSFDAKRVAVEAHGNVLTSIGFLLGLSVEEFTARELDHDDRDYQLNITIRAQKDPGA